MARVPVAGRVKTRLARGAGVSESLRFYRSTSRAVIGRLGRQPFWQTFISVTPDRDRASRVWPVHIARIGQGTGDLGDRMQRPMRSLPPGPVCVVGTDIPEMAPSHVRHAFRLLGRHDAVFGPATDGGFWLVGLRRRPRVIDPYGSVHWSTADTLKTVLRNLRDRGSLDVGLAATLQDVDETSDLAAVRQAVGRLILP